MTKDERSLSLSLKYCSFICGILLTHILTKGKNPLWLEAIMLILGGVVFGFVILLLTVFAGDTDIRAKLKPFKNVNLFFVIIFVATFFMLHKESILSFIFGRD